MESTSVATKAKTPKIFYGWWIVAAGCIMQAVSGAFSYYGFSAFFTPLINEFGWSRAALSGAISVSRLEGGILALPVGILLDRFGPRKIMFFGIFVTGIGYMALSQINSLITFYLVFVILVQGGGSFGFGNAVNVAVANWFRKKRGRAIGIITMGLSFGGAAVPIVAWIIDNFGWRTAAVVAGLLLWGFGFPLATLVRHRPQQYGYLPDGDTPPLGTPISTTDVHGADKRQGGSNAKVVEKSLEEEVSFSPMQAIRTMAFWSIAMTFAARHLVTGSVAVHLLPYLIQDRSLDATLAATIVGLMAIIGAPGRVLFGWLGDRTDKRYVMAGCFIFQSVGITALNLVPGWTGIALFLGLYAPTYSGVLPLIPAIQAEYFGPERFGTIRGMMTPVGLVGTVIGPVFAGYVKDVTGSYGIALTAFAISNLLALTFIMITRRPKLDVSTSPNSEGT